MKKERQEILRKLIYNPKMSFNELWENKGESNSFAYHLKVLVEDGLIDKVEDGYCLSSGGKEFVAYIEEKSGERIKFPLVGVLTVVYDEDKDKYLLIKRTKEPFYGVWGFVGGRMKFDDYIYDCAQREILRETGLTCDIEMKGIFSSKTYNDKKLSYSHQMFIILATNPRGELIEKTVEGECKWMTREELEKLNIFPNVPKVIDAARGKGFGWLELDRLQEEDKFVGMKVLRDEKL